MLVDILKIVRDTAADGPGLRTSVYFAGCSHKCPGCHNPQSWNRENGTSVEVEWLLEELERYGNKKVTLTGGDPLLQEAAVEVLVDELKSRGFSVWLYTGYTREEITNELILSKIDGLVDGRFEQDKRDTNLRFRGSSNQKIYLRDSQGILKESQGTYFG